jgi:hypothetical protein
MQNMSDKPKKAGFRGLPGDPSKAPRCGAKTRKGTPCRSPAMVNPQTGKRIRCRMHGGACTGPRTPEGKARSAAAHLRHGRYTQDAIAERAALRAKIRSLKRSKDGLDKC